jgi:hypothetical protein
MVFRRITKAFLLLTLVSLSKTVIGQKNYTISGIIKSKINGEYIIGASVKVLNTNFGTTLTANYTMPVMVNFDSLVVENFPNFGKTVKVVIP